MIGPNNWPVLTQNGGQLFKGGSISYKNFPILSHMKGTTDFSTGKSNTLFIPTESLIWKITLDSSLPDSSWEYVMEGDFLEGYSRVLVHQKLFPAGGYVIDNMNSLFLFNATKSGKIEIFSYTLGFI